MMADRPSGWPPGVERISLEDLGRLGINPRQELFWDGRHVEIRRRLTFTGVQKLIALVVTICAILGGLGGFVTGFNNASIFLCARHISYLTCPLP
jgi:hypothetical protein